MLVLIGVCRGDLRFQSAAGSLPVQATHCLTSINFDGHLQMNGSLLQTEASVVC